VRGQLGLDDRNFKGNFYESNKDRGTASSPQLVVALQHQYVVWCGAGSAFSACITIELTVWRFNDVHKRILEHKNGAVLFDYDLP
jgi:hypothetical protein